MSQNDLHLLGDQDTVAPWRLRLANFVESKNVQRVILVTILVNAVAPGVIETEMSEQVRDLAGDEITSNIILKRYGLPSEIANAVWFLSSDLASYITGQVLSVDGGFKF